MNMEPIEIDNINNDPEFLEFKANIGKYIMDAAKKSGITKTELQSKTGVHFDTIMKWQSGKTTPSWKNIYILQKVLCFDIIRLYENNNTSNIQIDSGEDMNLGLRIIESLTRQLEHAHKRIEELEKLTPQQGRKKKAI